MAQTANFGEDRTDEGVTQTVGPTSGAVALATEARARMMARKSVKPACLRLSSLRAQRGPDSGHAACSARTHYGQRAPTGEVRFTQVTGLW